MQSLRCYVTLLLLYEVILVSEETYERMAFKMADIEQLIDPAS